MVDGTDLQRNDEPGANSRESDRSKGVQPGGITPQLAEALEAANDPRLKSLVEEDIRQRNRYLTAERQRLSQDVQLSGIFRGMLQDSQFQRYMEAREKGDVAKFFRAELANSGDSTDREEPENNRDDSRAAETLEDSAESTGASDSREVRELRDRLAKLEAQQREELQARQRQAQDAELNAFMEAHPDWEEYLPAMQKVSQEYPGLSLEKRYSLAKWEVEQGLASLATEDSQQQPEASPDASASETSTPENSDSARDASRTTVPTGSKRERAFLEAFEKAKQSAGIDGPVAFEFSG